MKAILLFVFISLATLAKAADITLAWDANPPTQQITKYSVYQAPATGVFVKVQDVTSPTVTLNLAPGVYRFRVTAVNAWGESPPSNEVATPEFSVAPVNLKLTITVTVP